MIFRLGKSEGLNPDVVRQTSSIMLPPVLTVSLEPTEPPKTVPAPVALPVDRVTTTSAVFAPSTALTVAPAVQAATIPAGSDAGQLFESFRRFGLADISRDEAGKWHFKMGPNGWFVSVGLAAFFAASKFINKSPRRRPAGRPATRRPKKTRVKKK